MFSFSTYHGYIDISQAVFWQEVAALDAAIGDSSRREANASTLFLVQIKPAKANLTK